MRIPAVDDIGVIVIKIRYESGKFSITIKHMIYNISVNIIINDNLYTTMTLTMIMYDRYNKTVILCN
jgi:hypothetical protein